MHERLKSGDAFISVEGVGYSLLAAALASFVFCCQHVAPVWYVRLIAEDCLGEYASAVCFGLAGMCLALTSYLVKKARPRRIMLALMALAVLLIAGALLSQY